MPTPNTSDHLGRRAGSERQVESDAAKGQIGQRLVADGLSPTACCGGMQRLAKQVGLYDGVGVARAAVGDGAGPEELCSLLHVDPQ